MTDWGEFQPLDLSIWKMLFVGAVVLLTAGLSFANWKRRGGTAVGLLEGLRFVIVCLILFTLMKPEFLRVTTFEDQPEVVVLRDISGSMGTMDLLGKEGNAITRQQWVAENIDTNVIQAALVDSSAKNKIKVTYPEFGMSGTNSITAGTDIFDALEEQRAKNKNLRAIFLLSDGDWNYGSPPQQAAVKLGADKIPVFTLTVGSSEAQKDLILETVNPPNFGLFGERIAIPFRIQSHLDVTYRQRVLLNYGPNTIAGKDVVIPPHGEVFDTIVWEPTSLGNYTLTMELPEWTAGSAKELTAENNRQSFHISIRTEKLNVLVVESYPRWEYRYLRNAMMRDPGVDADVLLLHPELGPGAGLNYIQKFPETREQLAKYDVVFLGDVGIGQPNTIGSAKHDELTPEQCDMIRGLVDQQGSGLVFMPGARGRQLTFLDHPIGDLIPVQYEDNRPQKNQWDEYGHWATREVRFKLTSTGRGHTLTKFNPDEFQNEVIWKNLPGYFWCAAVERARPGSQVLATHESKRGQAGYLPILATRPWGAGEVLFMGTDAAWRWRRGVEDVYHYNFWGQVIRWMAHKRKMAKGEGVRLTYNPENPKVGEEISLQATMLDLSGGADNALLRASIRRVDNNSTRDIQLAPLEGGWGVFQGSLKMTAGGNYDVKIYNPNNPNQTLMTTILVEAPTLEKLGQPANAKVMREIAARSGGETGQAADLSRLLAGLSGVAKNEEIEERFRLWSSAWWAGGILFLLAVYWVSRKVLGLI